MERYPLLDITVRRPEHVRGNTSDIKDNLLGPSELRDNLFIGQGSERRMTPRVDSNLMPVDILVLKSGGEGNTTRSDNEEGGLEFLLVEIAEQFCGIECWAVIIGQAPGLRFRTLGDIFIASAATAGPPTTSGICSRSGIGGTTTWREQSGSGPPHGAEKFLLPTNQLRWR